MLKKRPNSLFQLHIYTQSTSLCTQLLDVSDHRIYHLTRSCVTTQVLSMDLFLINGDVDSFLDDLATKNGDLIKQLTKGYMYKLPLHAGLGEGV
jgi:hypothetical protein